MEKGFGVNPNLPPVPLLDDETLARVSYQYGIPQPQASPILKTSSMISPGGFMAKVNAAATEIKLNALPSTPDITPFSLSSEAVEAINSAAANTQLPASESISTSDLNTHKDATNEISTNKARRIAARASRAAERAARIAGRAEEAAKEVTLYNNPFHPLAKITKL